MIEKIAPAKHSMADVTGRHNYPELISVFNRCFAQGVGVDGENTRLVCGGSEPMYYPAGMPLDDAFSYHRIIFAHGFFASALHELAHWCVAGKDRRRQVDFGYWYIPDGRTLEQQRAFERVESRAQAIEWLLASACDFNFAVSVDNLTGQAGDNSAFKAAVYRRVEHYLSAGVNSRTQRLLKALADFYGVADPLAKERFSLADL